MDPNQGELYIGRDSETDEPVVLDAGDLTTHGVIVGMTGSGKTGLGIDLIEEALLSGISCLIIDPKGDMGDVALNFPDLRPDDFEPWIDQATAAREDESLSELARSTAERWKAGLEQDGMGSDRMRRLRDGVEITIYTPGSAAGVGLNVLGSMRPPDLDWSTDAEVARDEISSLVSSLLVLAGIDSDPVSGREHILLANIVEHSWREGEALDLATLVAQIPKPPFRKMGVFEIDTFFPEKERMELALKLNSLLASPSFATWMEGVPLDVEALIGGEKTRAAIVYMAHLSDEERQFVVTLLLGKTVTWARSRPGTSELRTLIYMDEVFGFAPPTKEPPSKTPILTILKQARAHGVGMVLSTQNPVDLDYKAMANAGTWMVGRLQTENDKRRILEGLASASGEVDIELLDKQISNLDKRQFVLHSTKDHGPRIFRTRWAMCYLAGPLTREQVMALMGDRRAAAQIEQESATGSAKATQEDEETVPLAPSVAEGIPVSFLDPAAPWAPNVGASARGGVFEPAAAATVELVYDDAKAGLEHTETYEAVIFPLGEAVDPAHVMTVDHDERDFIPEPVGAALFPVSVPRIDTKTFWKGLESDLKSYLVANRPISVWKNDPLGLYSRVDEPEEAFRARCVAAAREASDAELAKLKDRFQTRIDRVREQIATAQARFTEADAVAAAKSEENLLGTAGDLLGALLGGKSGSSAIKRSASRRTAAATAEAKADTAEARYNAKMGELADLERELADDVGEIVARFEGLGDQIEVLEIPLEKTDVRVIALRLVWVPVA